MTSSIKTPAAAAEREQTRAPLACTIPEAARELRIGKSMLYELIKQGRVKKILIGRRALVARAELERFVRELGAAR